VHVIDGYGCCFEKEVSQGETGNKSQEQNGVSQAWLFAQWRELKQEGKG
jgi:hypothetical protein